MMTQDQTKLDDIGIEIHANLKRYRDARSSLFWMIHSGQHYTGRVLDDTEIAEFSKGLIEVDAKIEVYIHLSNMLKD